MSSSADAILQGSLKRKRQLLPLGVPPSESQIYAPILSPEQRPVLRVNRACNTCRRQKMRCDGPDKGTPCARCKTIGVECVFEKVPPNKVPAAPVTSRMSTLESKIESIQATQIEMQNSVQEILHALKRPPVIQPALETTISNTGVAPAIEDVPLSLLHPTPPPIHSLISPCLTPSDRSVNSPSRFQTTNHPFEPGPGPGISDPATISLDPEVALDRDSTAGPNFTDAETTNEPGSQSPQWQSNDPSGNQDEVPAQKRRRIDARQAIREDGDVTWNPNDYIKEFRNEDSTHPDPIDRGSLPESEARDLFNLFFESCHPRMPIFDPKIDTFESIRRRICLWWPRRHGRSAHARDGGSQPSALQLSLWDEAIARAKESMFQRVKDLEVIQGLLLLSAWSDSTGGTCWIVAGHAIRCGVEMGIHKALPRLGSESHSIDEEVTQVLVSSARVWCALFAFEYQLAFGIGRHTMTGHPKSIKNARDILLNHPLSNPSDMRLVSACEIMSMEYQILDTLPNTDAEDPRTQAHLREGRLRMDTWLSEWASLLSPIYPPEHYMQQTIKVQHGYGYMAVHMACMPRIITSVDLDSASPWERENCLITVTAAKEILRISAEEPSYRDGLRYSPSCFYGGVSFVGALVLRLGSILPEEQEYIYFLVTELSRTLEHVPTCRFKFSFDALLKEHRDGLSDLSTRRDDTVLPAAHGTSLQTDCP
ncbi:hypothetical protein K439DRAFT_1664275 [Ramaria rubella]|nr:hypothetical protein K439DRAFT_1664275 [Ramaria rubella]